MPKGKKTKKAKKAPKRSTAPRTSARGMGIGGARMQIVPGPQFIADTARLWMKYTDSYLLTAGSTGGTAMNLLYSLNDPSKCNITSNSGNPQGWSVYSGQFQKYVVLASKIHWRIRNMQPGGTFGASGALGAIPTNSCLYSWVLFPYVAGATNPSSVTSAAVQKYATRRHEFPRNKASDGGSGFPEPTQQNPSEVWSGSHAMSVAKLEGEPNLRQSQYEAAVASSPTRVDSWYFVLQDVLADATAKGVWYTQVEVSYDVIFFDRILNPDSIRSTESGVLRSLELKPVCDEAKLRPSTTRFGDSEIKTPSPPETVDRYTDVVHSRGPASAPETSRLGDVWVRVATPLAGSSTEMAPVSVSRGSRKG